MLRTWRETKVHEMGYRGLSSAIGSIPHCGRFSKSVLICQARSSLVLVLFPEALVVATGWNDLTGLA